MNKISMLVCGSLGMAVIFGQIDKGMATNIVNTDDQGYALTLTTESGSETIELAPGASLSEVCAGCTIEHPELGSLVAGEDQTITIQDGEFLLPDSE